MSRKANLIGFLLVGLCGIANCLAMEKDEILFRPLPDIVEIRLVQVVEHFEVNNVELGPSSPILRQYLLGQVFVDSSVDPDFGNATGGIVNQLTTFFEATNMGDLSPVDFSTNPEATLNLETGFYEIAATARLSFTREKTGGFPDDPDDGTPYDPFEDGIIVDAVFVHNTTDDWIEVTASDLTSQLAAMLLPTIRIRPDECSFIGLTPIFQSLNTAPFSGRHITNAADINGEGPSGVRLIDPGPTDWMTAVDDTSGASLFATMEIRGPVLPEIFLSFSGMGDGDAVFNTTANATVSDSLMAYVWVNDAVNIDTGAGLDVSFSTTGVTAFTSAESFDFDILLSGTTADIGDRWGDAFGAAASVTTDFVEGLNAFSVVSGSGILTSQISGETFEDQGHDDTPGSEAFLFGAIGLEVVGAGTTQIFLSRGSINIVNDSMALDPVFGSITVNATVAEPLVVGDTNGDGVVSLLDVEPFVTLIFTATFDPAGDINQDGVVNLMDIAPFIDLLGSQ